MQNGEDEKIKSKHPIQEQKGVHGESSPHPGDTYYKIYVILLNYISLGNIENSSQIFFLVRVLRLAFP